MGNLPDLQLVSNLLLLDSDEYIPSSVAGLLLSKYFLPEYPARCYARVVGRVYYIERCQANLFDFAFEVSLRFHEL
jgi:hypothetical protein